MEYSEKIIELAEYLDVEPSEIIEVSEDTFEYDNYEYKVLSQEEVNTAVGSLVSCISSEVKEEIARAVKQLGFSYYIIMEVDDDAIETDIWNELAENFDASEYTEWGNYYIFTL